MTQMIIRNVNSYNIFYMCENWVATFNKSRSYNETSLRNLVSSRFSTQSVQMLNRVWGDVWFCISDDVKGRLKIE